MRPGTDDSVPLRQHIEAILDEQRRGMLVAEQEREKAASALRAELARAIEEGDRGLRLHITQQVDQIKAAFISADLLEQERIGQVSERLSAVERQAMEHVQQLRRERELVTAAQQEAIAKAERATETRFESVNEFRAQLSDTIARFLPREVADAQIAELRQAITTNQNRIDRMSGHDEGEAAATKTAVERRQGMTSTAQAVIAGLALLVAVLSVVVVVILANAGH